MTLEARLSEESPGPPSFRADRSTPDACKLPADGANGVDGVVEDPLGFRDSTRLTSCSLFQRSASRSLSTLSGGFLSSTQGSIRLSSRRSAIRSRSGSRSSRDSRSHRRSCEPPLALKASLSSRKVPRPRPLKSHSPLPRPLNPPRANSPPVPIGGSDAVEVADRGASRESRRIRLKSKSLG